MGGLRTMGMVSLLLLQALLAGNGAVASAQASDAAADAMMTAVDGLIHWISNTKRGFVNIELQNVQIIQEPLKQSKLGVFATKDIPKGEMLASVPVPNILAYFEELDGPTEGPAPDTVLPCESVEKLVEAFKDPDNSPHKPYLDFLAALEEFSPQELAIPSIWSPQGKDLLMEVLSGEAGVFDGLPPMEPIEWIDEDYLKDCKGEDTDIGRLAAAILVSRGDNHLLVPFADIYNHRNGDYTNIDTSADGRAYSVHATRDIKAGEQLYMTLNMCETCGGRQDIYGVAEILRDYGFVEDYPQIWYFSDPKMKFRIDVVPPLTPEEMEDFGMDANETQESTDVNGGALKYKLTWQSDKMNQPYILKQLRRLTVLRSNLLRLGRETYAKTGGRQKREGPAQLVPEIEWDIVSKFVDSAIIALSNARVSMPDHDPLSCTNVVDDECTSRDLYMSLDGKLADVLYRYNSCDISKMMGFKEFDEVESIQSEYQTINYSRRVRGDIPDGCLCLDLDDTVQICDNYRPHYHEYGVHYPARFLDQVKRVAFIGGGDSMILHEVLKYPDVELVVGLELDQQVVRTSFKWFHTQPHFDDDRVEWWFGDARKSLLLLPREYTSSFDLVIIDLSETATSLTVSDHLDIFEAMSLLVKPDGILVKNERYFPRMSNVMDYSMEFHFHDCPMICGQAMIIGSNERNLFTQPLTDHGVETILLPDLKDYPNSHYLVHDFRANDPVKDGGCTRLDAAIEDQIRTQGIRDGKSEGMLMIVDIENVAVPLDQATSLIMRVLDDQGFSVHASHGSNDAKSKTIILLAEGYVVIRRWPEANYVALDIHLWGRFDLMDSTRSLIVKALGAGNDIKKGTVSSYRIIVSGMYGSHSWDRDHMLIGPDLAWHSRNCNATNDEGKNAVQPKLSEVMTSELWQELYAVTFSNLLSKGGVALIFCGLASEDCKSAKLTEETGHFEKVTKLYECPDLAEEDADEKDRHECRTKLVDDLREDLMESGLTVTAAILDDNASYVMGQIFASFWANRRTSFQKESVKLMMAVLSNRDNARWRHNAIERTRRFIEVDPLTRFEFLAKGEDTVTAEFSILTVDNEASPAQMSKSAEELNAKFSDIEFWMEEVSSGAFYYQDKDEYKPREFADTDYDSMPGQEQFQMQIPIGRQTVYQLWRNEKKAGRVPDLMNVVLDVVEDLDREVLSSKWYTFMGDGSMAVAEYEGGNIVAVWDGRSHITVSNFSLDQEKATADKLLEMILSLLKDGWAKELRDDFPRGVGRVINYVTDFADDVEDEEDADDAPAAEGSDEL